MKPAAIAAALDINISDNPAALGRTALPLASPVHLLNVVAMPHTSSISVICFTEMKFKSQSPSVTPSALVLVRLPLHVILRVEAAFPLGMVPKTSVKMKINVRRFGIAATTDVYLKGRGVEAAMAYKPIFPSIKGLSNPIRDYLLLPILRVPSQSRRELRTKMFLVLLNYIRLHIREVWLIQFSLFGILFIG